MHEITLAEHKCMCPEGDSICGQPARLHLYKDGGGEAMVCMVHLRRVARAFTAGHPIGRHCGVPNSILLTETQNTHSRCVDANEHLGPQIIRKLRTGVPLPFQMGTR